MIWTIIKRANHPPPHFGMETMVDQSMAYNMVETALRGLCFFTSRIRSFYELIASAELTHFQAIRH